jgi:hypothetical protein
MKWIATAVCVLVTLAWVCFWLSVKDIGVDDDSPSGNVATFGSSRSGEWASFRKKWLEEHPECEACGSRQDLTVHHIVLFSVDPSRELDRSNLITLCEWHHLTVGHDPDGPGPKKPTWKQGNPMVREHAKWIRKILHK